MVDHHGVGYSLDNMSREAKLNEIAEILSDKKKKSLEIIQGGKVVDEIQLPSNEWLEENIEGNPGVEITDKECISQLKILINRINI